MIDLSDNIKHDWHKGRINITDHILNAHRNTWLKPSDLTAFIIVHRHYMRTVPGIGREVYVEIPGWVEDHPDAKLNYIKGLARGIEERIYDN